MTEVKQKYYVRCAGIREDDWQGHPSTFNEVLGEFYHKDLAILFLKSYIEKNEPDAIFEKEENRFSKTKEYSIDTKPKKYGSAQRYYGEQREYHFISTFPSSKKRDSNVTLEGFE